MVGSNIPKAREILQDVLDRGPVMNRAEILQSIREALDLMTRRSPARRTRNKSAPVTPTVVALVKALAEHHPGASVQQIANKANVNPGRVSEILQGQHD